MNKKVFTLLFFTIAILLPAIYSCQEDDAPQDSLVISTINNLAEENEFYFTLDNGETMFPGEITAASKRYEDGQRAFVMCNKLEEKADGYDYNVRVKQIQEIPTKDIITIGDGENTEENVGNDPINITYMWITYDRKYLTIEYQYYGTQNLDRQHSLNLAINPIEPEPRSGEDADEYIHLEFRHNNEGDQSDQLEEGYVSFKLDNIKKQMGGKKGLHIRTNTIYENTKAYEVDFPTAE